MSSLLDRKLLFITGKGGVGKTTVAAAVALQARRAGKRTIVVEVGEQSRLAELFAVRPSAPGEPTRLQEGLDSLTLDPDRALLEWLQALGGRVSGRVLASSGTFQYFAAAAPGAKEIFTMVKLWQLTYGSAARGRTGYDLVVVDAPATGHALALLGSPRTFGAIAKIGPVADHTRQVHELLEDERRSAYLAVALGTEMAVTETIELEQRLHEQLGRRLSAVIVNNVLPRRFSAAELEQIESLSPDPSAPAPARAPSAGPASDAAIRASAVRAARAVHERARFQHNQIARLRRRSFEVLPIPFLWEERLELDSIRRIGERLAPALGQSG